MHISLNIRVIIPDLIFLKNWVRIIKNGLKTAMQRLYYQVEVRWFADYRIKLHNPLNGKWTARFFEFWSVDYNTQAENLLLKDCLYSRNRLLGYLILFAICCFMCQTFYKKCCSKGYSISHLKILSFRESSAISCYVFQKFLTFFLPFLSKKLKSQV